MDQADSALAIATLRALRRILREAEQSNRQLAAATGLIPSQLLMLSEIGRRGETTPSALASALCFSQATVTNIADRLAALGYVARMRGEQDRRTIRLTLTGEGRSALRAAPDLLQARFGAAFPALPDWEQAMILAGLERLADVLGASEADAAPLIDSGAIDRTA